MLVYGTQSTSDPTVANLGSIKAAYDYRAFGEQVDLTRYTDKVTETFTGKELDDETDLSNHGARMLDPMLGLWIAVDPERFFSSPYLYMGNGYNPIRFVDLNGKKPGDKFDTPDEAAKDWTRYVNDDSKIMNREAATYILKTSDGKYQTPPVTLWANEAGFKDWQIDVIIKRCGLDDLEKVGVAHTHGDEDPRYNSEKFSSKSDDGINGDIEDARLRGIPLYLGTPSDKFMKFDPANNKTTSEPLYDDLPENP
ncbi:MAG: DUF4329 domain-containing protein, partial [Crenarchaeota archaeon]|nr:DUF4329 domain-containing protein [Thermoproteota archaeon]